MYVRARYNDISFNNYIIIKISHETTIQTFQRKTLKYKNTLIRAWNHFKLAKKIKESWRTRKASSAKRLTAEDGTSHKTGHTPGKVGGAIRGCRRGICLISGGGLFGWFILAKVWRKRKLTESIERSGGQVELVEDSRMQISNPRACKSARGAGVKRRPVGLGEAEVERAGRPAASRKRAMNYCIWYPTRWMETVKPYPRLAPSLPTQCTRMHV